jgi:hypothetical protein
MLLPLKKNIPIDLIPLIEDHIIQNYGKPELL